MASPSFGSGLRERGDGDEDDADGHEQDAAPLKDVRERRIGDDRECQDAPQQWQRRVARATEEREDLARGEDRDDRDACRQDDAADGQDHEEDRDEDGGADRPLAHPCPA